ncbi:DUF4397 domain-containing protein [Romboutsia sp. 1001713B170207_170306_H8]|uniref:DUF4397 domain-containing protein n=1 Tax=Romboutsia sp. 1001713B170207_170306_H8 TaxID=2787112 RepID=UPI001898DCC0|nr:DUF4397 domain-containing protein [Romboutsia sp. 1001713B170207_170306_H8]
MKIRLDMNTSYIRVLHAAPNAPAVDVYAGDMILFSNLTFEQFSSYIPVPQGSYTINVYIAGTEENPVISQNVDVPGGSMITVASTGNLNNLTLVPYIESNPRNLQDGKSRVRAIHLSPNAPEVDIYVNGNEMFSDVEFREATDYIDVNYGEYRIEVKVANTDNIVLSSNVNLKDRKVYSLYVLGDVPNLTLVQSLDGCTYMLMQ